MKKTLWLIIIFLCSFAYAQELPTEPANGGEFSLGTKFTIKLVAVDSLNFDISIIAFEGYSKIVDMSNDDDLFEKTGKDSTISFYFCIGSFGKNKKEKKNNMKVLLIMKNYSRFNLEYTTDIQRKENGEFEPTSNIGMYSGAKGTEIWPYMIHMIRLSEFRIHKVK